MNALNQDQFNALIAQAQIKPRLKQELRFAAATAGMTEDDWRETEMLSITDRGGNKGVLLIAPDDDIFVAAYEITKRLTGRDGRAQAIICDLCKTWQAGSGAGSISFKKDKQAINSVRFLCCADVRCSQHVRTKTTAALISRAHLREDMTNEKRVQRLKAGLRTLIDDLQLVAAELEEK